MLPLEWFQLKVSTFCILNPFFEKKTYKKWHNTQPYQILELENNFKSGKISSSLGLCMAIWILICLIIYYIHGTNHLVDFKNRQNLCLKILFYIFEDPAPLERLYVRVKKLVCVYIDFCRTRQFPEIPKKSWMVIWNRLFASFPKTICIIQLVLRDIGATNKGV